MSGSEETADCPHSCLALPTTESSPTSPNKACSTSGNASSGGSLGLVMNRSSVPVDVFANGLNLVAVTDKPVIPVVLGSSKDNKETEVQDKQTMLMESCRQDPQNCLQDDHASWLSIGTWPWRQNCSEQKAVHRSVTRHFVIPPGESVPPTSLPVCCSVGEGGGGGGGGERESGAWVWDMDMVYGDHGTWTWV